MYEMIEYKIKLYFISTAESMNALNSLNILTIIQGVKLLKFT